MSQADIRSIPLRLLHTSESAPQKERRLHYDKDAIDEMIDSLRTMGQLQPIVVRPVEGNGDFEIVAGERRYLAALKAGMPELVATVLKLTDQQVLEIQLVENLQREGLHELAEAEGYEALMEKYGYTVEDLVAKVGKSKGSIYARLKLLSLGKDARKAFYDGKINASIALLLARIPVEKLQVQALKAITETKYRREPMSVRDATDYVHEEFMLRLNQAPFPTNNATLVPAAGTCGACPKRTGNQPELFEDVKSADVCTDPTCFKAKKEAWAKIQVRNAEQQGVDVIRGTDAKKIAPYGDGEFLHGGYVKLDDRCQDDPKNRSYRQLLGQEVKPQLLEVPETGKFIEVIKPSSVAGVLRKQGIKSRAPSTRTNEDDKKWRAQQQRDAAKRQRERALHQKLWELVRAKVSAGLARADLERIAVVVSDVTGDIGNVLDLWKWGRQTIEKKLADLSPEGLSRFIVDCLIADEIETGRPTYLLDAAKRLKIDVEKVRKELEAAATKDDKAAAPAKRPKKPARKK